MTKTEERFYKTFDIKTKYIECPANYYDDYECHKTNWDDADCPCGTEVYPKITDRMLLELICLALKHYDYSGTTNMKNIKDRTFNMLLMAKRYLKEYDTMAKHNAFVRKVQKVFKGEE